MSSDTRRSRPSVCSTWCLPMGFNMCKHNLQAEVFLCIDVHVRTCRLYVQKETNRIKGLNSMATLSIKPNKGTFLNQPTKNHKYVERSKHDSSHTIGMPPLYMAISAIHVVYESVYKS